MKKYQIFTLVFLLTLSLTLSTYDYTVNAAKGKSITVLSPSGTVFLGGGSIDDLNEEVWNALYNAAGGGTPRVAVFCSGSQSLADANDSYYNDTPDYWSWKNLFLNYGFDPVFIPIAIDNYQTAAYDQTNIDLVSSAQVVWFNGGDQSRHARVLLKNDGSDTPLMTAVRNVFNNGGVVAGSSAGAAIQGTLTYGEGISYGYMEANQMISKSISDISLADPNNYDNGGYTTGFNFLSGINAIVDTHVGGRGRIGRMLVSLRDLDANVNIGVDENSAIIIKNGIGTTYGQYGTLILNGTNAIFNNEKYFSASNVKAYSLTSGDIIDFNTMKITSTKNLITNPYYSSPYESRDIFSTDEAFKVMEKLIDSNVSYAIGKSKTRRPQFILTFSKNNDTKGYFNNNKYTVDNLNLNITYK